MSLTRRLFLAGTTLLPGLGFATTQARPQRRFVLIILRGAMDGLGAVAPLGDPDYAALRPGLALTPQGALKLDDRFWLHPALAPVFPMYGRGEMAVLHAMASPYRERSHFDAQNVIETGLPRPGMGGDGWLNRALAVLGADGIRGIAFTPEMPLVLRGRAAVSNWQPEHKAPSIEDAVAQLYAGDPVLAAAYAQGLTAKQLVDGASGGGKQERSFPALAAVAGKTLAVAGGPNVAVLELGGWDTHVGQGTEKGRLAAALANLAAGVEALHQGLGPVWHETVVVAVTEFGRTARPNGTGGTDHGTAGAGFLFGGAVAGGRVIADWPGLAPGALYQNRDLAPTQDMRGVFKALLGDHLGAPQAKLNQAVFPGSAAVPAVHGLIRA